LDLDHRFGFSEPVVKAENQESSGGINLSEKN